jgi:hypothetical protein
VIAGLYSDETSRELFVPNPEIVQHRAFSEIIGSPDRLHRRCGSGVRQSSLYSITATAGSTDGSTGASVRFSKAHRFKRPL